MTVGGIDPLRALRERIYDLASWFRDGDRLREAQEAWRAGHGAANDLWDARIAKRVDQLQVQLADERLELAPLTAAARPGDLLIDLEATDLVAWLAAGSAHRAPAPVFGVEPHQSYVIRLARERRPRTALQPGLLYTHLRYHAIVPTRLRYAPGRSIAVRVRAMDVGVERCEAALRAGEVTVATTSFGDGAEIEWLAQGKAATVPTAAQRRAALTRAVEDAAHGGVDILVAPELTVPPDERDRLIADLRWCTSPLALFVPGSFHERLESRGSELFNRALLCDGKGNALCEHLKLVQFGELEDWLEDIHLGDEITVLVTPLGSVAVAICKDFCDDHVGQLWQQLQCEWLLVPAFGPGGEAHERAAKQIGRMVGTITVLAHEGRSQDTPNSFVHQREVVRGNRTAPGYFAHKIPL